jgi:acyl-homoserine lactone acylase PvdQ
MSIYTMRKLSTIVFLLICTFSLQAQINPKDVTIVRDTFGVPHIYGKTDADAAVWFSVCALRRCVYIDSI